MTEKGTVTYVVELPMCNFCQTREAAYDAKTDRKARKGTGAAWAC